ncbi:hypothetical protein Ddc_15021 [Ditylenchus destructor]|nr:hypothetical protein Ddc_15021 [Ditylenchus destructor]
MSMFWAPILLFGKDGFVYNPNWCGPLYFVAKLSLNASFVSVLLSINKAIGHTTIRRIVVIMGLLVCLALLVWFHLPYWTDYKTQAITTQYSNTTVVCKDPKLDRPQWQSNSWIEFVIFLAVPNIMAILLWIRTYMQNFGHNVKLKCINLFRGSNWKLHLTAPSARSAAVIGLIIATVYVVMTGIYIRK